MAPTAGRMSCGSRKQSGALSLASIAVSLVSQDSFCVTAAASKRPTMRCCCLLNAAAWASYAARGGLDALIVMPQDAPVVTRAECLSAGAELYLVDGVISDAGAIVADIAPVQLRGRYMGVFASAFPLAGVLAPIGGTAIYEGLGATTLWIGCGLLGAAASAAALALTPAIIRGSRRSA